MIKYWFSIITIILLNTVGFAQIEFTWLIGSEYYNYPADYGTILVENSNNHPGARENATTWTTPDGNLWLFGGKGKTANQTGFLNDLWSFSISTNKWTWRGGTNIVNHLGTYVSQGTSTNNGMPSCRQNASSWVGIDGCLYLFGGQQTPSTNPFYNLNDLWKFNPNTNEWTWLMGSSVTNDAGNYGSQGVTSSTNNPPSRFGAYSWVDSAGNFWLFGGRVCISCNSSVTRLNDLWKFDPNTKNWTWVSGSNQVNQSGVYGTQNQGSITNYPGARQAGLTWVDSNDNLWLFGGDGCSENGTVGYLSDLWKFEISSGKWTWVKGNKTTGIGGTYGTLGTSNSTNLPGSRQMSISFNDNANKLWLLGGWGQLDPANFGRLNDLWSFNLSDSNWTWEAGCNCVDDTANYGAVGQSSSNYHPGGRRMSASWQYNGDFFFFGGNGYDKLDSLGLMGDLWKISVNSSSSLDENQDVLKKYLLYPNPTTQEFMLSVSSESVGKTYKIVDQFGKMIKTGRIESEKHIISIEGIENGYYTISIGNIHLKGLILR